MSEEADIQKAIMVALKARGYRVKRHNCGTRNNRMMGMGPGTPDLYTTVRMVADCMGALRDVARPVWLEVKATKGKASPEQIEWMREANDNGEYACVVRSVAEALAAVESAAKGEAA